MMCAREGASLAAISDAISAVGVDPIEANEFARELVDAQVLVDDMELAVTADSPIAELVHRLEGRAGVQDTVSCIDSVSKACARLDESLTALPEAYEATLAPIANLLGQPAANAASFVQVDAFVPSGHLRIPQMVVDEAIRAVQFVRRMSPRSAIMESELKTFRETFKERYGQQWISLAEALDDETGIGFLSREIQVRDAAPLLDGLSFGSKGSGDGAAAHLTSVLLQRGSPNVREVVLNDDLFSSQEESPSSSLPDSIAVAARLACKDENALARGEYRLIYRHVVAPSALTWLGRFCEGVPELDAATRDLASRERQLHGEKAILAELIHLPQGRFGNFLCRPAFREYEIPYLGRSSLPNDKQILLNDLVVSVVADRVVLRSLSRGREVLPRNANAHNPDAGAGLTVYRFLHALQYQGVLRIALDLGGVSAWPYVPRLAYGRTVLSPAAWKVSQHEISQFARAGSRRNHELIQEWRDRRGVDALVVMVEGDNELLLDLENPYCTEVFVQLAMRTKRANLIELLPDPTNLGVSGADGGYQHELYIPLIRRDARPAIELPPLLNRESRPAEVRRFAPGSSWMYWKLYTGTALADGILTEVVGPLLESLTRGNPEARAFFLRYGDPRFHLRVRVFGDSAWLWRDAFQRISDAFRALVEDGRVIKLEMDTYDREIERYGGWELIETAEQIFALDSTAVIRCLSVLDSHEDLRSRSLVAIYGVWRLLCDFYPSEDQRLEVLDFAADGIVSSRSRAGLRKPLAKKLREWRQDLSTLLEDPARVIPGEIVKAFELRSSEMLALVENYRQHARGVPGETAVAFIHMHVNRILRSAHNHQEFVIYELLRLHVLSIQARTRAKERSPSTK
jgi:thiopeptide-type bacteriocin biosynthesis protein